jgi:hypothetical protein
VKRIAPFFILAFGLAACSGAGQPGGSIVPAPNPAAPAGPTSSQASAVTLTITVPRQTGASSTARRPDYVSTATQSVAVTPGTAPKQLFAIAQSAPGCTSANGTLTCVFSVSAAVGQDEAIVISTFANAAGTGTPLSTATVIANVVAGRSNPIAATLGGVVASVSVTLAPDKLIPGTAATVAVTVDALDAAGKTIVGPGGYVDANGNPVTIALSDSDSAYTKLSQTSITKPTSGITLHYGGCGNETNVTNVSVAATAGTIPNTPGTAAIAKTQFIYLANFSGGNITEYPVCANGNSPPARTLTGPFSGFLGLEAIDAQGYLYVVESNDSGGPSYVDVYAPQANGNAAPVRTIGTPTFHPFALSIDNVRHELYVSDQASGGVDVFASGPSPASGSTVLRTIAGSNTTISNPYYENSSVAFDPISKEIIFGNSGNKFLTFAQCAGLPSCNEAPVRSLDFYPYFPQGSLVDPVTEDYYVVDDGDSSLNIFAPGASGSDAPIRRIVGSNLPGAQSVDLDAGGNAYVSNYETPGDGNNAFDGSVTVFAPDANGNAVPIRTIYGSSTGIVRPVGIAVGP